MNYCIFVIVFSVTVKLLDTNAAKDSRDGLAMFLYSQLFSWLVERLNESLAVANKSDSKAHMGEHPAFVGVLDIAGFENFATNSLEQLWINLSNEKLQQHFNYYVFKDEMADYQREGVDLPGFTFNDNQHILDIIEGTPSVLGILDEVGKAPKPTGEKYLSTIEKALEDRPEFEKRKFAGKDAPLTFTIKHYAGNVTYHAEQFLEKNQHTTPQSAVDLLSNSKNAVLQHLLKEHVTKEEPAAGPRRRGGAAKVTVSKSFRQSLDALMTQLKKAYPSFIRCVKPNADKVKNKFVAPMVAVQLQYAGVMSAITIRQEGYPLRMGFNEFIWYTLPICKNTTRRALRQELKDAPPDKLVETQKKIIRKVLSNAQTASKVFNIKWPTHQAHMAIGHTKVFVQMNLQNCLADLRAKAMIVPAIRIKSYFRMWRAQLRFKEVKALFKKMRDHIQVHKKLESFYKLYDCDPQKVFKMNEEFIPIRQELAVQNYNEYLDRHHVVRDFKASQDKIMNEVNILHQAIALKDSTNHVNIAGILIQAKTAGLEKGIFDELELRSQLLKMQHSFFSELEDRLDTGKSMESLDEMVHEAEAVYPHEEDWLLDGGWDLLQKAKIAVLEWKAKLEEEKNAAAMEEQKKADEERIKAEKKAAAEARAEAMIEATGSIASVAKFAHKWKHAAEKAKQERAEREAKTKQLLDVASAHVTAQKYAHKWKEKTDHAEEVEANEAALDVAAAFIEKQHSAHTILSDASPFADLKLTPTATGRRGSVDRGHLNVSLLEFQLAEALKWIEFDQLKRTLDALDQAKLVLPDSMQAKEIYLGLSNTEVADQMYKETLEYCKSDEAHGDLEAIIVLCNIAVRAVEIRSPFAKNSYKFDIAPLLEKCDPFDDEFLKAINPKVFNWRICQVLRPMYRLPGAMTHRRGMRSAPSQSLTLIDDKNVAHLALNNFMNLQQYMKDRPGDSGIVILEEFLENVRQNEALLDESFCQIANQLTDNDDDESAELGWQVLRVLLEDGKMCSPSLRFHFLAWLIEANEEPQAGRIESTDEIVQLYLEVMQDFMEAGDSMKLSPNTSISGAMSPQRSKAADQDKNLRTTLQEFQEERKSNQAVIDDSGSSNGESSSETEQEENREWWGYFFGGKHSPDGDDGATEDMTSSEHPGSNLVSGDDGVVPTAQNWFGYTADQSEANANDTVNTWDFTAMMAQAQATLSGTSESASQEPSEAPPDNTGEAAGFWAFMSQGSATPEESEEPSEQEKTPARRPRRFNAGKLSNEMSFNSDRSISSDEQARLDAQSSVPSQLQTDSENNSPVTLVSASADRPSINLHNPRAAMRRAASNVSSSHYSSRRESDPFDGIDMHRSSSKREAREEENVEDTQVCVLSDENEIRECEN